MTNVLSMPTPSALPTQYQEFIALSRYARYDQELKRREKWPESNQRLFNFWLNRYPELRPELEELREASTNLEALPSMRTMMAAGPALERDNAAAYNCSAAAIAGHGPTVEFNDPKLEELGYEPIVLTLNHPIIFDELLYLLMVGTGVGFSVERQYIAELPTVGKPLSRSIYKRTKKNFPGVPKEELSWFSSKENTVYVQDSKYGWASALRIWIVEMYNGNFGVRYNTDLVRPEGTPLKTFGGRASGPGPLHKLFDMIGAVFMQAYGRKLTSLECHDIMCVIGSVVVVGGVRRTAEISLSNLSDDRMRYAKSGDWWNTDPHRAYANNSAVYDEKPSMGIFMREWQALYESKSGERGIINREAMRKGASAIGRSNDYAFLCNPCGEINLRDSGQMCNLSEVIVRATDTLEDLKRKTRLATIWGTLQATLTDFVYLSKKWKDNCEEERLLGVSMTGERDHAVLQTTNDTAREWIRELRQVVREVNAEYAKRLGINPAAAATCVKPSGTVSQLADTASGLHTRYAPYYIRTVRADAKDPLAKVMMEQGYPVEEAIGNPSTLVFSFPVKAPEGSIFRDDETAIEQLEYWLMWREEWCDHNASVTVYVKEHEWLDVAAWVYNHFDRVTGISFLPHTDHIYAQAPYQECDEATYLALEAKMPQGIDYDRLAEMETSDHTTGSQELACAGGACEIL